ncbi:Uncharacterized protein Fot_02238 [Forsythia ovata]|uniref:Uncharacterized protein n=1 Tax=Forsythia ovata TaxID=205694 RepID=A0ABD1X6B3_9LAMI
MKIKWMRFDIIKRALYFATLVSKSTVNRRKRKWKKEKLSEKIKLAMKKLNDIENDEIVEATIMNRCKIGMEYEILTSTGGIEAKTLRASVGTSQDQINGRVYDMSFNFPKCPAKCNGSIPCLLKEHSGCGSNTD